MRAPADCDGLCITAADVGIFEVEGVAYPHPGCPAHAPERVCECGNPDRCLSPTHGQITLPEALTIRHRQAPKCPHCRQPLQEDAAGRFVHRRTGSGDCGSGRR